MVSSQHLGILLAAVKPEMPIRTVAPLVHQLAGTGCLAGVITRLLSAATLQIVILSRKEIAPRVIIVTCDTWKMLHQKKYNKCSENREP